MIDPATGWIAISSVPEARADLVANQKELAWLTRYPIPNKITVDRSKEVEAECKTMMANDYGIPCVSLCVSYADEVTWYSVVICHHSFEFR